MLSIAERAAREATFAQLLRELPDEAQRLGDVRLGLAALAPVRTSAGRGCG